jgi:hypothetical protein
VSHSVISQREARRLKKRVEALEGMLSRQRSQWGAEYPGGVQIASAGYPKDSAVNVAVTTARKLRHAVVALADETTVRFYALPLASLD